MPLLSPIKDDQSTSYHLIVRDWMLLPVESRRGSPAWNQPENSPPNKKRSGAFPPKSTFWQPSPRTACYRNESIPEGVGRKRDFGNLGGHRGNVTRLSNTTD